MNPHVWTEDEITALPRFGNDNGWFYGLVARQINPDEAPGLVVAEIIPGMGWAIADFDDGQTWEQMRTDIERYAPETTASSRTQNGEDR